MENTKTIKRFFPKSQVSIVHQSGIQLSDPPKGVEVIIHYRENEPHPCCAEVFNRQHHAEIGLWFEGKELSDYDGVFELPSEVEKMLTELGYSIPKP